MKTVIKKTINILYLTFYVYRVEKLKSLVGYEQENNL